MPTVFCKATLEKLCVKWTKEWKNEGMLKGEKEAALIKLKFISQAAPKELIFMSLFQTTVQL